MSRPLWTPTQDQVAATNLFQWMQRLTQRGVGDFHDYHSFHAWSVREPDSFWDEAWRACRLLGELGKERRVDGPRMQECRWFSDSRLSFAENLLRPSNVLGSDIALFAEDEKGTRKTVSRQGLLQAVLRFSDWLRLQGVVQGDRVAAVLPNVPEAVIAMLATASLGAIWSSCAPDFGKDAIADRFQQIDPKVLITQARACYNGKQIDLANKVWEIRDRLPSIRQWAILGECELPVDPKHSPPIAIGDVLSCEEGDQAEHLWNSTGFESYAFNVPLYILYSSGTTGAPKCIVHGAGGTILQHAKELQFHADLRPGDRLLYYTSTGWMMWNWLVSGLQSGAAIVLFDGSPLAPHAEILFELCDRYRVTHFGASAKYFAALDKQGASPKQGYRLEELRSILSTGSPLLPETFDYLYREVKPDMNLASISGGTDIVSCFVLGVPIAPVFRGQIQGAGLGMDVRIFDDDGSELESEPGELVCAQPFPSMPLGFWNDPEKLAYSKSYFEHFPGVWCHGDWAMKTPEDGFVIYGRSDATLNPGGIRIGTAEIYRQVESFEEIAESLATALRRDGDEQIVLFVRMQSGQSLTEGLQDAIRKRLRERCSARHVPSFIIEVPDLPRTMSNKISEIAVRNAIHGQPNKNESALSNPESLAFFRSLQWEAEAK